jgi:hypothetical protein
MSTLCRAGRRWQKYGRAEKSSPNFRGSAEPIFLPSVRWASHPVAVSRSDLEKGSGKTYEPFELFRGYSVIVNPPSQLVSTQSKQACRAVAVSSAVAAAAKGDAAKAGQTMINLVKYELFGQDDNQIISKYFKVNDLQSE